MTATCPECGRPARRVGLKTAKHLLKPTLAHGVWGEGLQWCAHEDCDVVYFRPVATNPMATFGILGGVAADSPAGDAADVVGRRDVGAPVVFRRADLKGRARPYARGEDRLVCYCFEYTVADVRQDARSGRHLISGAIAAETRAGLCACEVMNPGGG